MNAVKTDHDKVARYNGDPEDITAIAKTANIIAMNIINYAVVAVIRYKITLGNSWGGSSIGIHLEWLKLHGTSLVYDCHVEISISPFQSQKGIPVCKTGVSPVTVYPMLPTCSWLSFSSI